MQRILLHGEGLFVLLTTVYIYSINEFSWVLFLLFLLVPDVSMVGFLINNRVGARIYNLFHTYILSLSAILIGFYFLSDIFLMMGLVWTAHISIDRLLGLGLKYQSSFQDTHLQRL
ncbi:DUF4260 domain-containing protein [Bacillus carboniphilus]|uniref:DUF4260 domain-containing protein n=1 Tax=Bacillus carboniphilus TaxID=86663 RepID=A0ABY9JSR1_9BACI|nr:DUF4260 domain-containing protein [Bacillus carboniphilus]WLR42387.1 DUF4260 domain-containing protein [Bacillus carboniphilus]